MVTDSLVQERLNQQLSEAAVFTPPITMPVINLTPEKGKAKPESKPKTVTESPKPTRTEPTPTSKPTQTTAGTKPTQTTTGTKPTQTTAGTKPANTNTPSAPNRPSPLANKKYQVIAGAFSSEKNAQARVQQLRKIGYPNAFVLGVNAKGLYQVSYGGFDSVDEARLQQREVQASKQEKKLDGGWILTQP